MSKQTDKTQKPELKELTDAELEEASGAGIGGDLKGSLSNGGNIRNYSGIRYNKDKIFIKDKITIPGKRI